jgi:hypothetical protein
MASDTESDVYAPKRKSRRWIAVLASFAGLLIVAEIACRIDAFFPLAHFDSALAKKHFELRREAGADQTLALYSAPDPGGEQSSVRPRPHPYFGWTSEREVRVAEEQGRWFETRESAGTFDVFVLGGSVAAEFGNRAGPALQHGLAQLPALAGRAPRVWNNAYGGYKAPQTGNLLAWLFALGQAPDAVVLIDGFNEVAVGMTNAHSGMHPQMPSFEFWGGLAHGKAVDARSLDLLVEVQTAQRAEQAIARTAVGWGFHHSALLTRITLSRLAVKRRAFNDALGRYLEAMRPPAGDVAVRGPEFDAAPESVAAAAVRGWTENARLVEALCKAHGVAFVHVLQPTLYDAGSKPMTSDEQRAVDGPSNWKEGVRHGYPRLREAGALLRGAGASCVDLTRMFETTSEPMYVDMCHLNEAGYARLAKAVLAEFARVVR